MYADTSTCKKPNLIRVDKNGTKYYEGYCKCPRCCGQGGADVWKFTGWTCYQCGGAKIVYAKWKEYTPEYEAKLEQRRNSRFERELEKRRQQADELNKKFLEHMGFNTDGKCYIVLGNTYAVRDTLKELGCIFLRSMGNSWVSSRPLDEFETFELSVDELFDKDNAGAYNERLTKSDGWNRMAKYFDDLKKAKEAISEYVGNVGDKMTMTVTLEDKFTFEKPAYRGWGTDTFCVYTLKDEAGNILKWITTGYLEKKVYNNEEHRFDYAIPEQGDKMIITATIKEHKEYDGHKETMLERVKLVQFVD